VSTGESADSQRTCAYVFYHFDTTQDTKRSDRKMKHVPKLVCLQQFSSKYENISDIEQDFIQCGKRIHSFWNEPV